MLLLILLALACALLLYYATLNQSYWARRGVPAPLPRWLFGDYKDIILAKKHLGHVFQDIYNEFPAAEYVGYLKMRQPCVLLRHPALIRSVFTTNFSSFSCNDIDIDRSVDPLLGNNPFVLRGEEWKRARSHLVPLVSPAKLKVYLPEVLRVCGVLTRHVAAHGTSTGEAVELETKELSTKYATDVVANAVFGVENNTFAKPDNTFYNVTSKLFVSSYLDNLKVMAVLFFPQLSNILKLRFTSRECEETVLSLTRQMIAHRTSSGENRNDFFQQMISYRNSDTQKVFTDEYVAAHCFEFLSDGTETSSDVICFTLFELAWHEDVQERLRREIREQLSGGWSSLTYESLNQLQYLDMVVMESLRLHPPAMSMHRVCTKPFTLERPTLQLQPGTPVTVSVYGLHMDPAYYPEPQRFLPDRFEPSQRETRDPFAFLPFGEGPRICLGMKLALLQVKAALVCLVAEFRLRPSPRSAYPSPVDPNVFLKRPLNGAWVCFQPLDHKKHL